MAKRSATAGTAKFAESGFYAAGRYFGTQLEHACAFAGRLVRETQQRVVIHMSMLPGHGQQVLVYVPEKSFEVAVARRDAHGWVIES